MSDPIMVDIQHLCMQRAFDDAHIPDRDIVNVEDGKAWINELITPIFDDINPETDEICVTNHGQKEVSSGSFMAVLTLNEFSITQYRVSARSHYKMTFSPYALFYDDRKVDSSFEFQILEMMQLVASSLKAKQASLVIRKSRSEVA
jgi:hypothetical protein